MSSRIYSLLRVSSIITSLVIVIIAFLSPINYKTVIWAIINFFIIVGFILDYFLPEDFTGRIKKSQKLVDLHNKLSKTNKAWYLNFSIMFLSLITIAVKVLISMWLI